jgi:hypothetical protein
LLPHLAQQADWGISWKQHHAISKATAPALDQAQVAFVLSALITRSVITTIAAPASAFDAKSFFEQLDRNQP